MFFSYSYMYISENIDYDRTYFNFDDMQSVEMYWMRLKDVCVMTPLGL